MVTIISNVDNDDDLNYDDEEKNDDDDVDDDDEEDDDDDDDNLIHAKSKLCHWRFEHLSHPFKEIQIYMMMTLKGWSNNNDIDGDDNCLL